MSTTIGTQKQTRELRELGIIINGCPLFVEIERKKGDAEWKAQSDVLHVSTYVARELGLPNLLSSYDGTFRIKTLSAMYAVTASETNIAQAERAVIEAAERAADAMADGGRAWDEQHAVDKAVAKLRAARAASGEQNRVSGTMEPGIADGGGGNSATAGSDTSLLSQSELRAQRVRDSLSPAPSAMPTKEQIARAIHNVFGSSETFEAYRVRWTEAAKDIHILFKPHVSAIERERDEAHARAEKAEATMDKVYDDWRAFEERHGRGRCQPAPAQDAGISDDTLAEALAKTIDLTSQAWMPSNKGTLMECLGIAAARRAKELLRPRKITAEDVMEASRDDAGGPISLSPIYASMIAKKLNARTGCGGGG